MKKTLIAAAAALIALSGCVAVPVYDGGYGYGGYGYDYYSAPRATFSFGYYDYDGPRYGHRQRHFRGGHRHRRD